VKQYAVNEIFYSVQGEGMRAGEASVFVRLAGCNLRCRMEEAEDSPGGFDCDTEFASSRRLTLDGLLSEVVEVSARAKSGNPWIVFTGGEPALQLDAPLVAACQAVGFRCAIETNGSKDVSDLGLDWVTVSPKVAEHAVRQLTATEVKYVRGYGQGVPKPACKAQYQLVSPAFDGQVIDARALAWCMELVKENPSWRLSIQMHKAWQVR
jgi:organic radical activating enzyme